MPSLAELGQLMKSKHPQYAHINDTELGKMVADKYPQYGKQFSDVPPPALPSELQPDKPESTLKSIAMTPIRGGEQAVHGAEAIANNRIAPGAADVIEGAGKMASPLLIPAAIANPIGTAVGLGGGLIAQKGGQSAAEHFGASPDAARLIGDVTGLAGGGAFAKGATALGRNIAPSLAESALGVRPRDLQFGARPGLAALRETQGVTPEAVSQSAGERIRSISPVLERTTELAPPVNLGGPLGAVRSARSLAARQGDLSSYQDLAPMEDSLQQNRVTGEAYPNPLPARDALELRRGFGREQADFNRLPGRTSLATKTARSAYGNLTGAIHEAAPGTADLDERIQSLIPVRDRAEVSGLGPDAIGRMVDKSTRPTGGLFPALFGYHMGGIPGAAEALGGQEMLASPTAKMAISRGLWRGVGGEKLGVPEMPQAPAARGLLTAGPLVTPPPEDTSGTITNAPPPPQGFRVGFPANAPKQLLPPSTSPPLDQEIGSQYGDILGVPQSSFRRPFAMPGDILGVPQSSRRPLTMRDIQGLSQRTSQQ